MRPARGALLWLLPSRRKSETRAHRLPHRLSPANRRCGHRDETPRAHRRLPMLRRADAKDFPAAPRLAPRPPATRANSPRMISARTTTVIVKGIFRATGQGDGEPCVRHGNAGHGTPVRTLGMDDERKNSGDWRPDAVPPASKTGRYASHAPQRAGNPPTQIP